MFDIIARRAAVAAGMLILVAGCKSQRASDNAAMGSDTSSGAMTTGAADTSSMATGAQSGQPGALSDANIVALLDEANKADSSAGAFALTKASDKDVKAFAKMMMGEHHALRVQGLALAKKLKLTPEAPADDPVKAAGSSEMAALQSAGSGAAFDRTYIDQEVTIHKAVIDLANKAHSEAQNAELKALIEKATPVVQKHLDRAETLQQKLGKATT